MLLENVERWELRNLDVSNKGAAPGPTERRAGILFRLTDFGTGHHYVVDDVDVHDVNGSDHKDPDPSGGILFGNRLYGTTDIGAHQRPDQRPGQRP
ncbi:hypothetical protein [Streptomyces sp. NPDC056543]|uniref:hypothetical protein n=1 Tax=unclassified Streptomyces TaxID=2593676 RepID=UPI00367FEE69